jgi:hypothetical protein
MCRNRHELLEMAVIESLPLRQQANSHRPWKRKIATLKSVPSEDKSEFSWLPFEYRSWELIRNPSGSEDAAVQPRTVVGDMFGNAVNVMLATGGISPGSATAFKDAPALRSPKKA